MGIGMRIESLEFGTGDLGMEVSSHWEHYALYIYHSILHHTFMKCNMTLLLQMRKVKEVQRKVNNFLKVMANK
jgi:hypothetical protein